MRAQWGTQVEIGNNIVRQSGSCLWPGYGPKSDATPFQPSTVMYMHDCEDGWIHGNQFFWRCSMMDLDVSDRVVFEDNAITLTEPGIPPHGNSISGYDYPGHPSSRWWSYARNQMSRPPSSYADKQDWTQRETVTTDGSGYWASGHAISITAGGAGLVLDSNMTAAIATHGDSVLQKGQSMLTLKVLGGPGTGQTRMVIGWDNSTRTLALESPVDAHFVPGASIVAIVGSFGAKAVVGNRFNWTEVVQFYSNTLGGVVADNHLSDCNVLNGGNVGNASVGAYGACCESTAWLLLLSLLPVSPWRPWPFQKEYFALTRTAVSPAHTSWTLCLFRLTCTYLRLTVARCSRACAVSVDNGPGPVWYTEFTGNTQVRSDGIGMFDQQVDHHGHLITNITPRLPCFKMA